MYFCYVDESGDTGLHNPDQPDKTGSRYFIMTGVLVDADKWKVSLDVIKSFRKSLAAKSYLNYDVEFHCAEMIDPRKTTAYNQMSIADRWGIIKDFADLIATKISCAVIGVVIDKTKTTLPQADYFTNAITSLYVAFDEFLKREKTNGIVLFDRANEKLATTHVRKMMGTGATGQSVPGVRIGWIIEDPIYRTSTDSFFIQAADMIAYTLKEQEFPMASRKKHNADRIFKNTLAKVCFVSAISDEDGIIRL